MLLSDNGQLMRTKDEILSAAKSTSDDHIVITQDEAKVLVAAHVDHRRKTSGRIPERDYLMRKVSRMNICGKRVVVE